MSFSVNTNGGALIALQYLSATQSQLAVVQTQINSGLKVATARDDGATFAIAQNQRGAVAGYTAVTDSLNRGSSAIDVALSAGQSISDLLIQLKTKALAASDASADTASRQALNQDFTALRDQIGTIVKNAVFNGLNLVDGSTKQITALASADGTRRITTAAQNLSLSGQIVTITNDGLDLDAVEGLDIGRDHPGIAHERELRSRQAFFWREEVLDPGDVLAEAVGHVDRRHRQPGRRELGPGQRRVAVPAGQAAAWRSGSVDCEPVAADHSVSVPLSLKNGGGNSPPFSSDAERPKKSAVRPGAKGKLLVGSSNKRSRRWPGGVACFLLSESVKDECRSG